ncbi:hypothetical protein INT46_008641 [Mucor plumbeus]|uniref:DUF7707 domain-containing protein n=1 Tax=Mucor plumbeus TaxID=97098 RepID=A0A8H7RJQ2_9FUNG|nr:hypothetical protein INT46_008641 [Mucor plumbeus]
MLLNGILVLLAIQLTSINAQTVNSSTKDSNLYLYIYIYINIHLAGLPNVEWDILKIDPSARENLCQRQTAYCANNCGGPNQAPKNFCNTTTMAWGCGCSHKVADFTPFLWPVVQAECSGKAQDCQKICNKDTVNPSTCAATCNAYYQCDTEKAPPSYLQTENPNDTPSYNGSKKEIANSNNPNVDGSSSDSHVSNAIQLSSSSNAYFLAAAFVVAITTT